MVLEEGLIGCLLAHRETQETVRPILTPESFYSPLLGKIYRSVISLSERDQSADALIVSQELQNELTLKQMGGHKYLVDLALRAPSSIDAITYAKSIKHASANRKALEALDATARELNSLSFSQDPSAVLAPLLANLDELTHQTGQRASTRTIGIAAEDVLREIEEAYRSEGEQVGLSTGFPSFDETVGTFSPGDLIILAGRPSMGKTALAANIALRQAEDINETNVSSPVLFVSLEMSDKQLAIRVLAERSGINTHCLRHGLITEEDLEDLSEETNQFKDTPLYIADKGGQSLQALKAMIRRSAKKHNISFVVIDYLQLILPDKGNSFNRTHEITTITAQLKQLAKELEIPFMVLSQLSRGPEARDNKRPQLSDLRDSGSIEQDADIVMFVYRDEYYLSRSEPKTGSMEERADWNTKMGQAKDKAEIIVAKNRQGSTGTVELTFIRSKTMFCEPSEIATTGPVDTDKEVPF